MRLLWVLIVCAAVAGCATNPANLERAVTPGMPASEVGARLGKPIAEGTLPGNGTYRDYSREPNGYYRVIFGPDQRVREVRNLHTEENFRNLKAGMTPSEVAGLIGVPRDYLKRTYANGTKSWTYRYRDEADVAKLLHVIFGADDRLLWYYWEWDPSVYSKGDGSGKSGGR